jgi:hypothetical protein
MANPKVIFGANRSTSDAQCRQKRTADNEAVKLSATNDAGLPTLRRRGIHQLSVRNGLAGSPSSLIKFGIARLVNA